MWANAHRGHYSPSVLRLVLLCDLAATRTRDDRWLRGNSRNRPVENLGCGGTGRKRLRAGWLRVEERRQAASDKKPLSRQRCVSREVCSDCWAALVRTERCRSRNADMLRKYSPAIPSRGPRVQNGCRAGSATPSRRRLVHCRHRSGRAARNCGPPSASRLEESWNLLGLGSQPAELRDSEAAPFEHPLVSGPHFFLKFFREYAVLLTTARTRGLARWRAGEGFHFFKRSFSGSGSSQLSSFTERRILSAHSYV